MEKDRAIEMLEFIKNSPSTFHVVENFKKIALSSGFTELSEKKRFNLERGKSYFITRGGRSIILFRVPKKEVDRYSIISAHTDSPTFKIKRNPDMKDDVYVRLNTEGYGGMIIPSWFDRPLSVAGRIYYKDKGEVKEKLLDFDRDIVALPSLAIHQNRDVNKGYEYHIQNDVCPILSLNNDISFDSLIAKESSVNMEDILDYDLYLYNRTPYSIWGAESELISSGRLDDLECAYLAFMSIIENKEENTFPLVALFDNEEVGSSTRCGALSDFLSLTLERIALSLALDREEELMRYASSLVLSADNAHALHPSHREKADVTNKTRLNGGVVIKYAANQKYATEGYAAAELRALMDDGKIKYQIFVNNSNVQGGSTLGNLSIQKVSIPTVDIGLSELAMHSSYESAGRYDVDELYKTFSLFISR